MLGLFGLWGAGGEPRGFCMPAPAPILVCLGEKQLCSPGWPQTPNLLPHCPKCRPQVMHQPCLLLTAHSKSLARKMFAEQSVC